jgi:hypothetical protein
MYHPKPPEPGRQPLAPVHEPLPPADCVCSWSYRERLRLWELRFLNAACPVLPHRFLPARSEAA